MTKTLLPVVLLTRRLEMAVRPAAAARKYWWLVPEPGLHGVGGAAG
ncbi:MAG TPA: hypothetical protein GXX28_05570 [Firmicutes bacterium]|nr:hypothetical protein [Bacillota bacterium]